jgi:uncharacterized protein YqeY
MSIQSTIHEAMVQAMRQRDRQRKDALSFLLSEMKTAAINRRVAELSDAEAVSLLQKQLRQREESLEAARAAGRGELAEANEYEIRLIREYLPDAPGEDETRELAAQVIRDLGARSMRDMGRVMAEASGRLPGVDKALLSRLVRAELSGAPDERAG